MRVVASILIAALALSARVMANEAECTAQAEAAVETAFKRAETDCAGVIAGGECSEECKGSLLSTVNVEDSFLRCVGEPRFYLHCCRCGNLAVHGLNLPVRACNST